MEQKRDLAIVLRAVAYEERHKVVTALTECHGKISALARNSVQSRRFGGALEPFAASEWLFVERAGAELFRVEEANIRRSFEGLSHDFQKLSLASVFNEVMLRVAPEREACPDLFKLHSNALVALEDDSGSSATLSALLVGYLVKVLQWNGTQPQIDFCLGCNLPLEAINQEEMVDLSGEQASWVCSNCRKTSEVLAKLNASSVQLIRVRASAVEDVRKCMSLPIRKTAVAITQDEHDLGQLFKFLEGMLAFYLPGFDRSTLKGLRFLGLQSSLPPLRDHQR